MESEWQPVNRETDFLIYGDVPKRLKGPHSKCGRSAQNRRESSNLSISAMRSAGEKLADLFSFYGETADRFCSMGATMSCSMAAADCCFVVSNNRSFKKGING